MGGMRGRFRAWLLAGSGVTVGAVVMAATTQTVVGRAATGAGMADDVNSFSATVLLRRGILQGAQQALDVGTPVASYRLDRRRQGDRWASVLTTTSPTRPPFVTPTGRDEAVPAAVARIEDAGDGSPLRFYSAGGEISGVDRLRTKIRGAAPLTMVPDGAALLAAPWAGGEVPAQLPVAASFVDALLPLRAASAVRREALRRRFGRGGTLRGLDRFVMLSGADTTEVLADPATGLVVEANVIVGGRLERHTRIHYVDAPGDRLLRQSLHVERRLPHGDDLREVVELVLTDVQLGEGR
jgi:hypothetical protein